LYGTAYAGGEGNSGMVWEITTAGVYKDLHDFGSRADGSYPLAGVTFDRAGNMYGTTSDGGADRGGIVWELTKAGGYRDLHDFGGGSDGIAPQAAVKFDAAGNMYGTTIEGGRYGSDYSGGTVWEITKAGGYKDLHDFGSGHDGQSALSEVTLDVAGDLFGTCAAGGLVGGGMVWEITSAGAYKDLHDFGKGDDGTDPQAGVAIDAAGNKYGTAWSGGADKAGMVWEITEAGLYKDLHDFGVDTDGQNPITDITFDQTGALYGTTQIGGFQGGGIVWRLSKALSLSGLTISPNVATGGASAIGTVKLSASAPAGGIPVYLSSSSTAANAPTFVTVPSGATSAAFTVKTFPVAADVTATISAMDGPVTKTATITVEAPLLTALSLSPSTIVGGNFSTGTVTISGLAPSAGVVITLSSSSKVATLPSSVTILSGKKAGTFTAKTTTVKSSTTATITAKSGSVAKIATLTIIP
jgi:uncharacterized repeat protein (TIGR03803 family)